MNYKVVLSRDNQIIERQFIPLLLIANFLYLARDATKAWAPLTCQNKKLEQAAITKSKAKWPLVAPISEATYARCMKKN